MQHLPSLMKTRLHSGLRRLCHDGVRVGTGFSGSNVIQVVTHALTDCWAVIHADDSTVEFAYCWHCDNAAFPREFLLTE
eukprot:9478264-Pyramimonas_sp.AAC.1